MNKAKTTLTKYVTKSVVATETTKTTKTAKAADSMRESTIEHGKR